MGLDMYMKKRTYVKNWDYEPKEKKNTFTIKQNGVKRPDIDPTKISAIEEEIMYWRKANAIHSWFINNCADGVDDCKEVYIEIEQIQELVDLCKQVLSKCKLKDGMITNGQKMTPNGWEDIKEPGKYVVNAEEAHELLPTTEGFFFGSTDYDEWYIQDLKDTVKALEPYLEKDEDGKYRYGNWETSFYYRASW